MLNVKEFAILEQKQASHLLWEKLKRFENNNTVVVSTSRESAATAYYLAQELEAPWQVLSCKEISHPANPLKTIGSVSTDEIIIHDASTIPGDYINRQIRLLKRSILSDDHFFSTIAGSHNLKNKNVIIVCDHLKNVDSIAAALKSINNHDPLKTLVASLSVEPETARIVSSFTDGFVFLKMETASQANARYSKEILCEN